MRFRGSIEKDLKKLLFNGDKADMADYHKLLAEIFLDIRDILLCGSFNVKEEYIKRMIKFKK